MTKLDDLAYQCFAPAGGCGCLFEKKNDRHPPGPVYGRTVTFTGISR